MFEVGGAGAVKPPLPVLNPQTSPTIRSRSRRMLLPSAEPALRCLGCLERGVSVRHPPGMPLRNLETRPGRAISLPISAMQPRQRLTAPRVHRPARRDLPHRRLHRRGQHVPHPHTELIPRRRSGGRIEFRPRHRPKPAQPSLDLTRPNSSFELLDPRQLRRQQRRHPPQISTQRHQNVLIAPTTTHTTGTT